GGPHPVGCNPAQGALGKAHRTGPSGGGEPLGVGQSARVVDADMHVLPADPADARAPVPRDTVADPANPAETLDVHVQELAGGGPLVTLDRRPRREGGQATEPLAAQDAAYRGPRPARGVAGP